MEKLNSAGMPNVPRTSKHAPVADTFLTPHGIMCFLPRMIFPDLSTRFLRDGRLSMAGPLHSHFNLIRRLHGKGKRRSARLVHCFWLSMRSYDPSRYSAKCAPISRQPVVAPVSAREDKPEVALRRISSTSSVPNPSRAALAVGSSIAACGSIVSLDGQLASSRHCPIRTYPRHGRWFEPDNGKARTVELPKTNSRAHARHRCWRPNPTMSFHGERRFP